MKTISITEEKRAYTEDEAKSAIEKFKNDAHENGYTVKSAGYTWKTKKKKGEIVAEGWLVKCVAIYNEFWEEEE